MSTHKVDMVSGEEALEKLIAGNKRYIAAKQAHPRQTEADRQALSSGQSPFAIILTCSDSRVPPEIIFDQGLGDLFVIRVAGNIVDDVGLGSIEYAAAHLHTPLLVVLGHSHCGAVGATVSGADLEGHLPALAEAIQPAVDQARPEAGDLLDNAINANARMVADQLRGAEPVLAGLVQTGQLQVVAARYDLETGIIEILD